MAGALREPCLGWGLRLANTEAGTCNEVATEVSVEVVPVLGWPLRDCGFSGVAIGIVREQRIGHHPVVWDINSS